MPKYQLDSLIYFTNLILVLN